MKESRTDNNVALLQALGLHVALFALMFAGLHWTRSPIAEAAHGDVIEADLVSVSDLSASMQRALRRDPEPLPQPIVEPDPLPPDPEPLPEPVVEPPVEELPPPEPDPAPVEKALARLGCPKERAVYVGDSEVDVRTAQNAGVPLLCAGWGFRDEAALLAAGAERVLPDPAALGRILLA